MKNLLQLVIIFVTFSAFTIGDEGVYTDVPNDSFYKGEQLTYKINFGIFSVGEAEMVIQDNFYRVNHRDCYKIDVYGKTTGMVDWVAKVDDHWGAYVDSAALVPHISYRNIKEGNYRKNEVIRFDHRSNQIEAKVKDKKTGEYKEPNYYYAPEDIRDMLAGYLYLRTMDFSKMKKGDEFTLSGFFEDTFYELDVVYKGTDKIKTKAGKFKAIKLVPIMPDNKLFDGEDSILVWISDDKNKIPLKIEAKMFIGSTGLELSDYKNLRNDLNKLD
ncbi:DUF3108 domain-containing protein [Fulvivirga maritima]|uniref:DUF3108 domain-containing protein n=1 Tax=Fulvivirga maritima TaxID=2904247 RepID=UPI001F43544C|nr:DUF3108 domain-containing protein [Fulvivirga maritima]UII26309.1 DUF3108 domain-containing protein [Fulvivirga maritima]